MSLDILPKAWTLHSFERNIQFTHVLALYDPFGVDVPLNFDITHTHWQVTKQISKAPERLVN